MNEMQVRLRERLAAAGVRELVEWDNRSELEPRVEYGWCPICGGTPTSYLKFSLDEDDHLHAETGMVCKDCGAM